MKTILFTMGVLISLACGCATNRSVNVIVPHSELGGVGITVAEGIDWFTNVASQQSLSIRGPINASRDLTEYVAEGLSSSDLLLILWLSPKNIEFEVSYYGTAKDALPARKTAMLFIDKLNQRQIPFKVREWVAVPPS